MFRYGHHSKIYYLCDNAHSSSQNIYGLHFFFQILFTEALLLKNYSQKLKPFLRNSYNMVGCLLLGFTLCMLFIEIVKLYVGRLRPHFLTVCQPNISTSNCSKTFITSYTCQGSDLDAIYDSR